MSSLGWHLSRLCGLRKPSYRGKLMTIITVKRKGKPVEFIAHQRFHNYVIARKSTIRMKAWNDCIKAVESAHAELVAEAGL